MSKYCPLILILLIGLVLGCRHEKPIDEVFRWPTSGVPEADSLLLEFEHRILEIDTPKKGYKDIEASMRTLSEKYPDNILINSRTKFIQYFLSDNNKIFNDSLHRFIANEKAKLDSVKHPFDWHKWIEAEIDIESDVVRKYLDITNNMVYFKKMSSVFEEGIAHVQLGNLMKTYSDTIQALSHYMQAEKIFKNLGQKKNVYICQLNMANLLSSTKRDSIYNHLLNDSSARKFGHLQIIIMQNYFISTRKIEYLDSALLIANNPAYFCEGKYIEEIPFIFAMKGNYYDQTMKNHKLGKKYILQGFDSIKVNDYPSHYISIMYKLLGCAYGNAGQYDSATYYLYQSIIWRDSLDLELQQARLSSIDAKNRIELAKKNIRQQRDIWIWGLSATIIVIIMGLLIFILNYKRRQTVKDYQQLLMEQKLQKSVQSVQIQTMVIEENEKLIDELSEQINTLRQTGEIDMASAGVLTKIMKLYKNDREAHKNLLEVQQNINADFISSMKEDFPELTDGQLKLASLIAIGTESPQICRILGIQLSSLHKSRYRLRTRLGLQPDNSLEEFLRNRNKAAM